jgi:hypothetical protein
VNCQGRFISKQQCAIGIIFSDMNFRSQRSRQIASADQFCSRFFEYQIIIEGMAK